MVIWIMRKRNLIDLDMSFYMLCEQHLSMTSSTSKNVTLLLYSIMQRAYTDTHASCCTLSILLLGRAPSLPVRGETILAPNKEFTIHPSTVLEAFMVIVKKRNLTVASSGPHNVKPGRKIEHSSVYTLEKRFPNCSTTSSYNQYATYSRCTIKPLSRLFRSLQ